MRRFSPEKKLSQRALVCASVAIALAGCGLFSGSKIPALPDFTSSGNIKTLWQSSVSGSDDQVFVPAVSGNSIYAAGKNGEIIAFDATNGRQRWRIDAGQKLSGGVGAGDDIVVVGTSKGTLLAYDINGKSLWRSELAGEIVSPATVDGRVVIARSADGRLFGLDAADGKRKWVYQRATPPLTLRTPAAQAVSRGGLFAGFPGGKLVALDIASGGIGWEASVALPRGATELDRVADVSSTPLVDGERVCAVAYQGKLACFEMQNGNVVWSQDVSSSSGLVADDKNIYVSDDRGTVQAFDKKSGASLWKNSKLTGRRLSAPAIAGNRILIGDVEGYVHALSVTDGALLARLSTDGSAISAAPQAGADAIIMQTRRGGVYAFAAQ
ncbi:MAG: outer membrane protein assembly factor BamB [Burkholderiales bacterium]